MCNVQRCLLPRVSECAVLSLRRDRPARSQARRSLVDGGCVCDLSAPRGAEADACVGRPWRDAHKA